MFISKVTSIAALNDNHQIVTIEGMAYEFIVSHPYKIGDLIVVFPPDDIIPDKILAHVDVPEYLKQARSKVLQHRIFDNYKVESPYQDHFSDGFTMPFGQLIQYMPVELFDEFDDFTKVSSHRLNEFLKVKRHFTKVPSVINGMTTDVEVQNPIIDSKIGVALKSPYTVYELIDGIPFTIIKSGNSILVGHHYFLQGYSELEKFLKPFINQMDDTSLWYCNGVIIGPKINRNYYQRNNLELYFYCVKKDGAIIDIFADLDWPIPPIVDFHSKALPKFGHTLLAVKNGVSLELHQAGFLIEDQNHELVSVKNPLYWATNK